MSRKTMREYDSPLYNIWPPPSDAWQQDDHRRAQALIDGELTRQRSWARDLVPWDRGAHLDDATPDFVDALWSVSEGKRDVRRNRS